jgi:hypothetical protein
LKKAINFSGRFGDAATTIWYPVLGYCSNNDGGLNNIGNNDSYWSASSGCGLPIGNLTLQLFSNIYLSALDDFVKRELKIRHDGRYVDDFYIVGNSRDKPLASEDMELPGLWAKGAGSI